MYWKDHIALSAKKAPPRRKKRTTKRELMNFIDVDAANDPCAVANTPVPGGFAGFSAVQRFIRGRFKTCFDDESEDFCLRRQGAKSSAYWGIWQDFATKTGGQKDRLQCKLRF